VEWFVAVSQAYLSDGLDFKLIEWTVVYGEYDKSWNGRPQGLQIS
jgi:hypothetical protein